MGRLEGKVCVITGAAGGIGREASLLFSEEGATVCVADVSAEAGSRRPPSAATRSSTHVDVSDPDSVSALYDAVAARCGGIDVLYNNAGIMPPTTTRSSRRSPTPGIACRRSTPRRLPLLQVRHSPSAPAWWRLGHQRRVVRRLVGAPRPRSRTPRRRAPCCR